MTRIPVHTVDDAPEQSRDALKSLEAQYGKVLNIHGAMAHSPAVIQSYLAISQALVEYSTIDAKTREAIALAVGNVDDCDYCQSAHTGGAQKAGWSIDETVQIRRGTFEDDPKVTALLALVREATDNTGNISSSTWQQALDSGWSDVELTEASAHIAINLFTNHFNHLVQTDLDVPAAPGI